MPDPLPLRNRRRLPRAFAGAGFVRVAGLAALLLLTAGCGITRMSDTFRTGNEQMLLSTAIDRAINEMDFSALAGKDVYFDPQYLRGITDEGYVISSMRQKLLASGVLLRPVREEATYIVEARAGAVGTNRHDVLVGIPQVNLPNVTGMAGVPSAIPEIPFAKSTHQKGVAKLAMFAYNQLTGQPVWQSGAVPVAADARDTWVLGTGPFQRGTIYSGTNFAGSKLLLPFAKDKPEPFKPNPHIPVTAEATFAERPGMMPPVPPQLAKRPQSVAAPAGPPLFQPAYPPSMPVPVRAPVVPAMPNAAQQPQASSGFSTAPPAGNVTTAGGGNATGGNAAAGLLFLGNGARQFDR